MGRKVKIFSILLVLFFSSGTQIVAADTANSTEVIVNFTRKITPGELPGNSTLRYDKQNQSIINKKEIKTNPQNNYLPKTNDYANFSCIYLGVIFVLISIRYLYIYRKGKKINEIK